MFNTQKEMRRWVALACLYNFTSGFHVSHKFPLIPSQSLSMVPKVKEGMVFSSHQIVLSAEKVPSGSEPADTDGENNTNAQSNSFFMSYPVSDGNDAQDREESSEIDISDSNSTQDSDETSEIDAPVSDVIDTQDSDESSEIDALVSDTNSTQDNDESSEIGAPVSDDNDTQDSDESSESDAPVSDGNDTQDSDESSDIDTSVSDCNSTQDSDESSEIDAPVSDSTTNSDQLSDMNVPDSNVSIVSDTDVEKSNIIDMKKVPKIDVDVEKIGAIASTAASISADILSAFRWGAANALTASLPTNQREELLTRLSKNAISKVDNISQDVVEGETIQAVEVERGSVEEEIATSDIQEAKSSLEKWEKEKEELTEKIEEAARERVKNEIAIQTKRLEEEKNAAMNILEAESQLMELEVQRLKEQLDDRGEIESRGQELIEIQNLVRQRLTEKEKLEEIEEDLRRKQEKIVFETTILNQESKEPEREATSAVQEEGDEIPHYNTQEYKKLSDEEKDALRERRNSKPAKTKVQTDKSIHPLLGPVVTDLGYKRIYLAPFGKLGTIPIWNKNRTYRNNRAKDMAREKSKSMNLGLPGIICLHEDTNGKLNILDGQHRVGMMLNLREKMNKEAAVAESKGEKIRRREEYAFLDKVLVEVYPQASSSSSEDHAKEVFLEINKAEPVKLVDMPGVSSEEDRNLITEGVENLLVRNKKMVSPSQNCRVPNVNIDNLRNSIFGANVLERHDLKTSKELEHWLLVQNAAMGAKYSNDETLRGTISDRAWKKASQHDFYLGLQNSWLYN